MATSRSSDGPAGAAEGDYGAIEADTWGDDCTASPLYRGTGRPGDAVREVHGVAVPRGLPPMGEGEPESLPRLGGVCGVLAKATGEKTATTANKRALGWPLAQRRGDQ